MTRAAEWAGRVGENWAREWQRTDRSFAGLNGKLTAAILAAAPTGAARLIDLGCGAGATSLAIAAARPDAEVIGLDLSAELVAVAETRRRSAGMNSVRCSFVVGNSVAAAAALAPVDLFFSRHGVMFFDDPVAAFAGLAVAAAPTARLVFSCFAAASENRWATETMVTVPAATCGYTPGPFAFADPARVAEILAAAGWDASPPERVAFRYIAGAGDDPVDDAIDFFGRIGPAASALRSASPMDQPALLNHLAAACARRRLGNDVAFPAAAWLWSARLREKHR